ncbi:hypothetical protein D3C80_1505890 [compost metagenome]
MDVEAIVLGLCACCARTFGVAVGVCAAVCGIITIGFATVDAQIAIAKVKLQLLGKVVAHTSHQAHGKTPAVEAAFV